MHPTAMSNGKRFFDTYVAKMSAPTVVEIGSQNVNGSLREVCPAGAKYIGLDFVEADGVDVVLSDPYRIPLDPEMADAIVCSSCFEHSEMFWLVFLEALRILKPGGVFYLNVPSNGTFHRYPVDCWRFYPDSGHAMVTWARRNGFRPLLLESYTARQYQDIWNDFVAVFLKDENHLAKHPDRILVMHDAFENGWMHGHDGFLRENSFPEDMQRIQTLSQGRDQQTTRLIRSLAGDDSQRLRACLESDWYLQRNLDLVQGQVDPYAHWLQHGVEEGRIPCEDPSSLAADLIQDRLQTASDQRAAELQHSFAEQLDGIRAANDASRVALERDHASREQALQAVIANQPRDQIAQIQHEIAELLQAQWQRVADRDDAYAMRQQQEEEAARARIDALESRINAGQQAHLERAKSEISDLVRAQAQDASARIDAVAAQLHQQRDFFQSQIGTTESRLQASQQNHIAKAKDEISNLLLAQAQDASARIDAVAVQLHQQRDFFQSEIGSLESNFEASQQRGWHQIREEITDGLRTQAMAAAERDQTLLAATTQQREESNARLQVLESQMAAHDAQIRQTMDSWITRTEQMLQADRERLQAQYQQSLQSLQHDLDSVESSMGWRLSAPIRAIAALFGARRDLPRVSGIASATALPVGATTPAAGDPSSE